MRYHNITTEDMINGEGLRVVLWVSGCEHRCEECQNPITWDENDGLLFDDKAREEIFNELTKDYISGITLSGGDPLFTSNREAVCELIKEIKDKFKDKSIWCYTGYDFEDVRELELLNYIDVLIDGKYDKSKSDNLLYWRGSSNQRVIDVNESLRSGKIVTLYGGK